MIKDIIKKHAELEQAKPCLPYMTGMGSFKASFEKSGDLVISDDDTSLRVRIENSERLARLLGPEFGYVKPENVIDQVCKEFCVNCKDECHAYRREDDWVHHGVDNIAVPCEANELRITVDKMRKARRQNGSDNPSVATKKA